MHSDQEDKPRHGMTKDQLELTMAYLTDVAEDCAAGRITSFILVSVDHADQMVFKQTALVTKQDTLSILGAMDVVRSELIDSWRTFVTGDTSRFKTEDEALSVVRSQKKSFN